MRLFSVIMLACLGFAAGCASSPVAPGSAASTPTPAPSVNLSGYPPAFRAGYNDGCASAGTAKSRDESRAKADASYAQGWQDGYDICRRRK